MISTNPTISAIINSDMFSDSYVLKYFQINENIQFSYNGTFYYIIWNFYQKY
jgi:hypothetical protein